MGQTDTQNNADMKQQLYQEQQKQAKMMPREAGKTNVFSFQFAKDDAVAKELRKPRSRAYMEIFDAIDMLSTTDEEIIERLKANMNEEMEEEFQDMTAEEILEEIKASIVEEFQSLPIEEDNVLLGIISECYITGCDCHAITPEGDILDHYSINQSLPSELEKGRKVFHAFQGCRCVEIYTHGCLVINEDSSVTEVPNASIK